MTLATTVFRYKCGCGQTTAFHLNPDAAHCPSCGRAYPVTGGGAIVFARETTEQNAYFDSLYKSRKHHKTDDGAENVRRTYANTAERALCYLRPCGVDFEAGLTDASILDAACGSGWVTAGLMSHPNVNACRFHASDISADGLEMLGAFHRTKPSNNLLEMSVQNAERMVFEDAAFDFVIGSSVLHHFNEVQGFLSSCRRILKTRGVATFGEPFAVGYGIGAAVLMMAQKQLRTTYKSLDAFYNDLALRVAGPPEARAQLVDKHLFLQSTFISMARTAGFSDVEFIPFASSEFYRDSFIDELLAERGVQDQKLARTAKDLYRVIFHIFDTDTYAHSVSAFNQIVLRA